MKPLIVAAILASALSVLAQEQSPSLLAQRLKIDPKARESAGARVEALLLDRDASGRSFVAADVNRAALGALARDWAARVDAGRLAPLLAASVQGSPAEKRLLSALSPWTGPDQITRDQEKARAVAFLEDACDKAATVLADPKTRREIEAAILANESEAGFPGSEASIERARKLNSRRLNAGVFGPERDAGGAPKPGAGEGGDRGAGDGAAGSPKPGGGRRTPEEIQALVDDLNAAQRAGQGRTGVKLKTGSVPNPGEFQSLGSVDVAPEPGAMDRAASLYRSDAPTIKEDLATISASLKDAELPTTTAINEGNPSAIAEFFVWLRSAKESDMPSIDYTILPKGEVGSYALGALSKGDIKLNHFIRDEPAHARASVLVHELYHYWDKKVAKNYYANVSYGKIDPATKHTHEYDAYLATSLYWQMVKKEGSGSALTRLLDRIPTDPGQVRELVNGAVAQ